MQRQITMQKPGAPLLQYYNTENGYIPVPSSYSVGGGMWYNIDRLDLRGLLAGKENGVLLSNIVLQEDLPIVLREANDPSEGSHQWVCDIISTYKPTEKEIAQYFRGLEAENVLPGFLAGRRNISASTIDVEPHNPNQVIWGLWRLFALDTGTKTADNRWRTKMVDSSFFGEGDPIVSPQVYWTRVAWSLLSDQTGPAGGKPLALPAANLVMQGTALEMTTPQEVTQMMRASGR